MMDFFLLLALPKNYREKRAMSLIISKQEKLKFFFLWDATKEWVCTQHILLLRALRSRLGAMDPGARSWHLALEL